MHHIQAFFFKSVIIPRTKNRCISLDSQTDITKKRIHSQKKIRFCNSFPLFEQLIFKTIFKADLL